MKQFIFTLNLSEDSIALVFSTPDGVRTPLAQASLEALRNSQTARDAWVQLCGGAMMSMAEKNV